MLKLQQFWVHVFSTARRFPRANIHPTCKRGEWVKRERRRLERRRLVRSVSLLLACRPSVVLDGCGVSFRKRKHFSLALLGWGVVVDEVGNRRQDSMRTVAKKQVCPEVT